MFAPSACTAWWAAGGMLAAAALLWLIRAPGLFAVFTLACAIGVADMQLQSDRERGITPPPAQSRLAAAIYASPMQGPTAAFAAATLVADRSYVAPTERDAFRGAGIAHLLALSGFHVGIMAMLAMWITTPLVLLSYRRLPRIIAAVGAVWAFAVVGGMAPSLVRAAVMFSVLMLTRLLGRYPSPFNSLAVAATVILGIWPSALTDAGFVLSFTAVAGILVFADVINPFDRSAHTRLHALAAFVAVPAGAMLGTLPVVATVFGAVPMLSLPANVVAAVLFTPFYICALITTALCMLGLPAALPAACADALYGCICTTADALCLPVEVASGPWTMALYALIPMAAVCCLVYRRR